MHSTYLGKIFAGRFPKLYVYKHQGTPDALFAHSSSLLEWGNVFKGFLAFENLSFLLSKFKLIFDSKHENYNKMFFPRLSDILPNCDFTVYY